MQIYAETFHFQYLFLLLADLSFRWSTEVLHLDAFSLSFFRLLTSPLTLKMISASDIILALHFFSVSLCELLIYLVEKARVLTVITFSMNPYATHNDTFLWLIFSHHHNESKMREKVKSFQKKNRVQGLWEWSMKTRLLTCISSADATCRHGWQKTL